jgi:hypothetical protein
VILTHKVVIHCCGLSNWWFWCCFFDLLSSLSLAGLSLQQGMAKLISRFYHIWAGWSLANFFTC